MDVIKKIFYIFTKKQKLHALILTCIIIVGSLIEMIGLALLVPFIDIMANPDAIAQNKYIDFLYKFGNFSNKNIFLAFFAFALCVIYVLKNVYLGFMYGEIYKYTYDNQRGMASRLLECYLRQPYLFFTNKNSSELIRNIDQDTMMFFDTVSASMMLLNEVIVCGLLVVILLSTDPIIAFGVIFFLIICMGIVLKSFKSKLRHTGKMVRTSKANIDKWLLQTFGGIKETKVANKEQFFLNNVDSNYRTYAENHRYSQILQYLPKPIMETVSICGVLLVIGVKLLLGAQPISFVATLSVFAVAAFRLLPAFNRISNYVSRIMFNKVSVDALYHDLMEVDELEKNSIASNCNTKSIDYSGTLKIEHLSFRYPSSDSNVLTNISLEIKQNKSVAFIGPSGSGKTTLADLILGVLVPTNGDILANGQSISLNIQEWHRIIGYIPQNIFLMDDTIRNNIIYGTPEKLVNEERLEQAVRDAQLVHVIDELEDGINTMVGERGVRLSGGQRQRIGIARALYNNPQILVLDEATSALDNDTEKAIMEAIDNLAGKKTLIIIAHRLTTIKNCDYIYRIDNGVISDITDTFERKE